MARLLPTFACFHDLESLRKITLIVFSHRRMQRPARLTDRVVTLLAHKKASLSPHVPGNFVAEACKTFQLLRVRLGL